MEWTPLGADDYMKVEYMQLLNAQFEELRGMAEAIFDRTLPLMTVPVVNGEASWLLTGHINVIERGINSLASLVRPEGLKPTRTWLGENRDIPLLDYNDVNRWFESLALIKAAMLGRGHDFKRTGSYAAATDILRQRIRVVGL